LRTGMQSTVPAGEYATSPPSLRADADLRGTQRLSAATGQA
jgi:hypothetical protein